MAKRTKRRRQDLITIQSDASADGEQVADWQDFLTEFARVEQVAGSSEFNNEEVSEPSKFEVRMIRREGVLPTMRVKFDDKSYNPSTVRYLDIESVVLDRQSSRQELVLTCGELNG